MMTMLVAIAAAAFVAMLVLGCGVVVRLTEILKQTQETNFILACMERGRQIPSPEETDGAGENLSFVVNEDGSIEYSDGSVALTGDQALRRMHMERLKREIDERRP